VSVTDQEQSQLPVGWAQTRIGDICDLINGRAFKPTEWASAGIPIIRIQNLNDPAAEFNYCNFKVEEKYLVDNGQLLFAWSGTPGTSFGAHIWNRDKAVLNQHIFKVNINENYLNKTFLKHLLNRNVKEYIGKAHGTAGLAHITKGKFEVSLILLPPSNEQWRITSKIEALFSFLDAGTESLRKVQAQLKRYRQAVLKYAFEGKLTEEWRKIHKDKIECTEDPRKLDLSGSLVLPERWKWTRLVDVVKINPKLPEGGLPVDLKVTFLPMKAVEAKTGKVDSSTIKKYSEVRKGFTYFQNGDVLFAKITPCMENGKIALVERLKNGIGFGSTEFHVLRDRSGNMNGKLLFYFLLQDGYRKEAKRNMTGSAGQLRVPTHFLEETLIPLPPLLEQKVISEEIERRLSTLDNIENAINQNFTYSDRLRQSVLKNAFGGKLVPQDPTDESAQRLLARLKTERENNNNNKNQKQLELSGYVK
jgi:type I restriction enzyme S subunit